MGSTRIAFVCGPDFVAVRRRLRPFPRDRDPSCRVRREERRQARHVLLRRFEPSFRAHRRSAGVQPADFTQGRCAHFDQYVKACKMLGSTESYPMTPLTQPCVLSSSKQPKDHRCQSVRTQYLHRSRFVAPHVRDQYQEALDLVLYLYGPYTRVSLRRRPGRKGKGRTVTANSSQSSEANAAELMVRTTRWTSSDPSCMRWNSPDPTGISTANCQDWVAGRVQV